MRRALVIPVALVLAWWGISVTRSLSPARAPASVDDPPRAPRVAAKPATVTTAPAPLNAAGLAKQGSPTMSRPFEFQKELNSYLDLQAKVFLSAEEEREKQELLHHGGLMRALGRRLREATRSQQAMVEQDAAIDLLVEALKAGDSGVASEVLRDVVQDRQVEDSALDRASREQLAGLKAEVLYQWSAINPQMSSNLQAWLPGPVSQKIWSNVLRMQQSNQAESEARRRSARH